MIWRTSVAFYHISNLGKHFIPDSSSILTKDLKRSSGLLPFTIGQPLLILPLFLSFPVSRQFSGLWNIEGKSWVFLSLGMKITVPNGVFFLLESNFLIFTNVKRVWFVSLGWLLWIHCIFGYFMCEIYGIFFSNKWHVIGYLCHPAFSSWQGAWSINRFSESAIFVLSELAVFQRSAFPKQTLHLLEPVLHLVA